MQLDSQIIALIDLQFDNTNNGAVSCSIPRMISQQLIKHAYMYDYGKPPCGQSTTHVLTQNEDLWHDIIYMPRKRKRLPNIIIHVQQK